MASNNFHRCVAIVGTGFHTPHLSLSDTGTGGLKIGHSMPCILFFNKAHY